MVSTWEFYDGQHYDLGGIVVMPNHVHLLVTPHPNFELEEILQGRKRKSARELNQILKSSGKFWQKHSYDHLVRSDREIFAFQNYMAQNPVKAGLSEGEYRFVDFDWQAKLADQFGYGLFESDSNEETRD